MSQLIDAAHILIDVHPDDGDGGILLSSVFLRAPIYYIIIYCHRSTQYHCLYLD